MKKIPIMIVTLGIFAGFSSTAQADYSISIGCNTARTRNALDVHHSWASNRHPGRSPHKYYPYRPYPHYPVLLRNTVVYQQEKQDREDKEKFGISDVIVLSKAGVSDGVIIEKIKRTDSVFNLSVEEVEALRKEGVSARVVNYMLNTNK